MWTCAIGEAFLADIERHKVPACLILDPHLPGMNGAEVAQAIIHKDGLADLPMIVLTARPTSQVPEQILGAGTRVLLTKPVAAEELIDQVRAAVPFSGQSR